MSLLFFFLAIITLLFLGVGGVRGFVVLALATLLGVSFDGWHFFSLLISALLLFGAAILVFPNDLRRDKISKPLLAQIRGMLPALSDTERQALKSGTVDWDGELISGRPDWDKLHAYSHGQLSEEERAFIDGPVNTLCAMVDDWRITHELLDLPADVWQYMSDEGFFGLMIPKEFGGKGFSEVAHSEIVMRLSTRSVSTAVTVMVPNSLGPAELILEYGTDEQKGYYLPRLSKGEEIPCFALTSPVAGSDAGAIPDKGIVCKGEWQGEEVLGLRVTWNKRYITLAPVATLIGLAIKVYDPEGLLGGEEDVGVTCVMVPSDLDGVNSGPRHLPMNTPFMNGPTWGSDVFIPMEQVIGGQPMLGKGWMMLMECLSVGRSISLPALATGSGKFCSLSAGAYAKVREQFGRSISQFEGIQEALEPVAGFTYMMDAARLLTASMLDRGVRPSVPSALLKYRNTDLMRIIVNHTMDVVAGRGVITGPRNFIARAYQAVPIGITVEGANILTRSLMVFGQGAIRCHPYVLEEVEAAEQQDEARAVEQFDRVFYRHAAHSVGNGIRAFVLALTRGHFSEAPRKGKIRSYYRQLNRFSAAFSLMTEVSLFSIGGGLKARQRLSGRMADCLVGLYYASAVIKQWHEEDYPEAHRPLVEWSLMRCLNDCQNRMRRAIDNFPVAALRWPLKILIMPWGSGYLRKPDDKLGAKVARLIVDDSDVRDRITRGVYQSDDPNDALGRLLNAYTLANQTQAQREELHNAIRKRDPDELDGIAMLMGHEREALVDWAIDNKILDREDRAQMVEALTALYDVIRVDSFDAEGIRQKAAAIKGTHRIVERD
ncbi:acyl-CoA dehydrogenase [Biformimicrobium ophioploci]|uniref:Acyl-coenzyme A dehydrogenase n=1 Tax=Biformimicrobium ophioploci TaxID=3036711 RepID=A0ABQ6LYE5_9GAMM|nr:acyl-CoA dehydrogenase [Microbulbifer sp. NKW57]GMG87067.1 acyl-CoA dehydrogenase [Microbulbifer sp. NKW57]